MNENHFDTHDLPYSVFFFLFRLTCSNLGMDFSIEHGMTSNLFIIIYYCLYENAINIMKFRRPNKDPPHLTAALCLAINSPPRSCSNHAADRPLHHRTSDCICTIDSTSKLATSNSVGVTVRKP